jgi:hypothetical protein
MFIDAVDVGDAAHRMSMVSYRRSHESSGHQRASNDSIQGAGARSRPVQARLTSFSLIIGKISGPAVSTMPRPYETTAAIRRATSPDRRERSGRAATRAGFPCARIG